MKKMFKGLGLALMCVIMATAMLACGEPAKQAWQFDVGAETVEYTVDGTNQYSPVLTVNVRIVGGNNKEMYCGKVKVKSADMMASNFIKAVASDKGWAQEGIDIGFISVLGEFTNNTATNTYWFFSVNGIDGQLGCNQIQLRENDYLLLEYKTSKMS